MTDPIPIQRESAYDQLCVHIERLNDKRLREHHRLRQIHSDRGDGRCGEDAQTIPCRTLAVIDGSESVVKS